MNLVLHAPVRLADAARLRLLQALGPWAGPLMRDRELRVALAGGAVAALAVGSAGLLPALVLAVGPVLWGVPHVLADLRYLWFRPGHHRRPAAWLLLGAPLLLVGVTSRPAFGFAAVLGATVLAPGPAARRGLVLAGGAALLATALHAPHATLLVFAHLHNVLAVVLWWSWRERRTGRPTVALLMMVAGALVLGSGAFDGWAAGLLGAVGGMDLADHRAVLAPGVPAPWGERLVLLFAYGQTLHYAVWLRLVPEEDRPRETPRTFAATFRALRADVGPVVLGAAVVLSLALALYAVHDLFAARLGYLRAVAFHGYLELAAAAGLLVAGRRPVAATAAP